MSDKGGWLDMSLNILCMYHYSAPFFSENQQVMNFCSLAVGLKLAAEASRSDITDRLTFCDGVEQSFCWEGRIGDRRRAQEAVVTGARFFDVGVHISRTRE